MDAKWSLGDRKSEANAVMAQPIALREFAGHSTEGI